jgi:hypothetical protein
MMRRFTILAAALSCVAFPFPGAGQVPASTFDKPPQDVDDALRARVTEFYRLQVDGKFRLAEALVAEASKDDFYAAGKPSIKDFRIDQIAYSDHYTKAKVTMVGKQMVSFMGMAAPQLMDMPFPSFWKIDNGKWCFYYFVDPDHMTPFGKQKPPTPGAKNGPLDYKPADLSTISQGVKPDKRAVKLGDTDERVELTNTLPGQVTLSLSEKEFSGIEVKLDKTELKAGEVATLTIKPKSAVGRPRTMVGVIVQPSNQLIQVEVR